MSKVLALPLHFKFESSLRGDIGNSCRLCSCRCSFDIPIDINALSLDRIPSKLLITL